MSKLGKGVSLKFEVNALSRTMLAQSQCPAHISARPSREYEFEALTLKAHGFHF